jgi:4-amino-4-deoxy-L-arabinose transferase-like glycosyltransferase
MFYAPAMWLHLPAWCVPLVLSGVAVGLMYLLGTELFDGVAGLLAALLLLSLGIFRRTSIMIMPQAPMLFLALLAILAFIYWKRERRSGWMVLMGVCVGWGAITRPVDALCIGLPLAVAVLLELQQSCNRGRVKFIGLGVLGVLPFLVLQAVYDKGLTGHVTTLPWNYYGQLYDPYDAIGRAPIDPAVRPKTTLPQKLKLFEKFTVPAHRELIGKSRMEAVIDRTSRTLAGPPLEEQEKNRLVYGTLPSPLLIALLPVGLLGLVERRRWVVWLALLPFVALYASYSFFFPHYTVAIVPAVVVNLLAAKGVLQRTWPAVAGPVGLMFTLSVAAVAVTALPELNSSRRDQWFDAPLLRTVDQDLARIDRRPAIVLFKYDPERMVHEEPVYNIETAWPDDATVIRAHDLGAENARLFEYYAKRSPGRAVYRFDEGEEKLEYLGTVSELLKGAATRPAKR